MRGCLGIVVLTLFLIGFGGLWLVDAATNAVGDVGLHVHHAVVCAVSPSARWCGR